MMPTSRRGVAYTALAAGFFAINASVSKAVLEAGVTPEQLTVMRSIGAALVLGPMIAVIDRRRLRITVRELPQLIAYGVVGVALVQWLYFVSIDRLSVSLALLLEFTAPVLVALWARFALGEAVRARVWAALVLALAGLGMVAQIWSGLGSLDLLGVLAALAASASLAAYWLIGERAVTKGRLRDPLSLTFWGFVFASIVLIAVMPGRFGGVDHFDQRTSLLGTLAARTAPVWALTLVVIMVGTVAPFVLEVSALRYLSATQVGLVAMLEPVLATVVAWLWLEQVLSTWQAIGVAVVILGISLAQTSRPGLVVPSLPSHDDQVSRTKPFGVSK
jgi:drug/metabolite transporter (DMT)-like permease